eukprot:g25749.t1
MEPEQVHLALEVPQDLGIWERGARLLAVGPRPWILWFLLTERAANAFVSYNYPPLRQVRPFRTNPPNLLRKKAGLQLQRVGQESGSEVQEEEEETVEADAVLEKYQVCYHQSFDKAHAPTPKAGEMILNSWWEAARAMQSFFVSPRAVLDLRIFQGLNPVIASLGNPSALKIEVEQMAFRHLDRPVKPSLDGDPLLAAMVLHQEPMQFEDCIEETEFFDAEDAYAQGEKLVRAGGWLTDRPDTVIQDQGASSFLMGTEYLLRYIRWLVSKGFDLSQLECKQCDKFFRFGGDAEGHARWMISIPVLLEGVPGRIQAYVIFGATPMLLGRPILEKLQAVVDFGGNKMKIMGGPWKEIDRGKQGGHRHHPLEGGQRCREAENYPQLMAKHIAEAIMADEGLPEQVYATGQDDQLTGILRRLGTKHGPEAVRIAYRLHRNLGHPRTEVLLDLLKDKPCDPKIIAAIKELECPYCNSFAIKKSAAPAHLNRATEFNVNVQADVIHGKVAWNWLWENIERMLKAQWGKPKVQERALDLFIGGLSDEMVNYFRREVYKRFFQNAPAGDDHFKQSTTRLYFLADRVVEITLDMFKRPRKMVQEISGLGLRHVGFGIPTEMFGPYVSAAVDTVASMSPDDHALAGFRWSLTLEQAMKKAVAIAPRGKRATELLNISVGTQSISPLFWAIESGALNSARAMSLGRQRSSSGEASVVDLHGKSSQSLSWLAAHGDPKVIVHPVVVMFADLIWSHLAMYHFLLGRCYFLFTVCVFVTSQAVLFRHDGTETVEENVIRFACRCFLYFFGLSKLCFDQCRLLATDLKTRNLRWFRCFPIPRYLFSLQHGGTCLLAILLILMYIEEPIMWYLGDVRMCRGSP